MPTLYRYTESSTSRGGLSTAKTTPRIRKAISQGLIATKKRVLKEGERLDQIAGQEYGDSRLWWVIAAASNIGWWMQLPPGTLLTIPINLAEIDEVI